MPLSICAITSTRADYGILTPLLKRMQADPFFDLTVVATGTHLLTQYGHTLNEILVDGFQPVCVPIMEEGCLAGSAADVSRVMAEALQNFAQLFAQRNFQLLLVLGDRFEIEAICCAAVNARLPIAHLHGGESTQGAIDECYRHAITKMSYLHFPCCEPYRQRIIQLGENPERVHNVGALAVENIRSVPPYPMDDLAQELDLPLSSKPYALVTFHPVTQESAGAPEQLRELMAAMDAYDGLCYIITKSNADEGGCIINEMWDGFAASRPSCCCVSSLGMRRYLTALGACRMMIGNSSSGIIEAPICGVPAVNIGDRQKGRLRTAGIVDCIPQQASILAAMRKADDPAFHEMVSKMGSPYGNGHSSAQIVEILKTCRFYPNMLKKTFYDLTNVIESEEHFVCDC